MYIYSYQHGLCLGRLKKTAKTGQWLTRLKAESNTSLIQVSSITTATS